jgi:hypothetical protein
MRLVPIIGGPASTASGADRSSAGIRALSITFFTIGNFSSISRDLRLELLFLRVYLLGEVALVDRGARSRSLNAIADKSEKSLV